MQLLCCLQLRTYCASLSQQKQPERTSVLIRQLADWAVGDRKMYAVLRLPLDGLEEQVWQLKIVGNNLTCSLGCSGPYITAAQCGMCGVQQQHERPLDSSPQVSAGCFRACTPDQQ